MKPHQSGAGIRFLTNYHIYIDLQHTLDKVFFASSYASSSKTLSTRPNLINVVPFFAALSLASLAIVSVLWQSTRRVPLLSTSSYISIFKFKIFIFFLEIIDFRNFQKLWDIINLVVRLRFHILTYLY